MLVDGKKTLSNQCNLRKGTLLNLMQVALIASSVTPMTAVLVLNWLMVVAVAYILLGHEYQYSVHCEVQSSLHLSTLKSWSQQQFPMKSLHLDRAQLQSAGSVGGHE